MGITEKILLRCLSQDIISVSIRLKSIIKTPKGYYIIKKAERVLLNERIRSINTTINMLIHQRDTCIDQLKRVFEKETTIEECEKCINMTKESRYKKTLEHQRLKFERLCQKYKCDHSNIHHGDHASFSLTRPNERASNSNSSSSLQITCR